VLLVPVNVQLIIPLLLGSFDTLAVNVWLPFIGTEIEDGLIEIAIEGGGLISLEYQEALFELDPTKLPERVSAAESVLLKRLHDISQNQNSALPPDVYREKKKIEDALSNLRLLMRVSKAA